MWMGRSTEQMFDDMCLLACNEHKQDVTRLRDYNKLVKMKKKIFWMMKIHIMDPFLFNADYNQVAETWLACSTIVPEDCLFPLDHKSSVSCELKEKVVLFDSVSTYTLASLSKVCCICEKLEEENDLVQYYDTKFCTSYASDLSHLENQNVQDALLFVHKLPLFKDIRQQFDGCDKETVCLSFLISYYYFLDISNNPLMTLNYFEEVFDEVREEMKSNDLKDRGNEEYKKQNYKIAINAYSAGLSMSCYSYYLFGNRAQTYLKLDNHHRAELDCRAALILRPEWSKGYYRLAQSLVGQKKIHEAHMIAEFGLRHSNTLPLVEYTALKEYRDNLCFECVRCQNSKPALYSEKEMSKIKPPDFDSCSDVPELTDSSSADSSDSESDNIEEVVSKSDEQIPKASSSEVGEKEKPQGKGKKMDGKQKVSPVPDATELKDDRLKNFANSLTEGSSALANNCSSLAKHHFYEALSQIKSNPELYQLEKSNFLTLKYSYAMACCKCGTLEDLTKALSLFKEIIAENSEILFPAAFYGLALSYYKMNNFKDALHYLKAVSSAIEQDRNLQTHNWPGTDDLIEETDCAKLKVLVEEFVKKCECPPPPDAICRYECCSLQPVIYFSDPDFKGFTSLHCNERCLLQYHMACWKAVKDAFDRSDKEFLDSHCITPDCGGFIIRLEIVGKNGCVEKYFESEERKPRKHIKHKKTKLEKKFEIRELRKSKRQRTTSLCENHKPSEETPEPVTELKLPNETTKRESEGKVSEKEKLNFAECPQNVTTLPVNSDLSATAKPFYVIKRDVDTKEPELKPRHKEKKKPKKSTLSIDEFCGDYSGQDLSYYSEYRMRLHRLQETRRVIEENDTWPAFCESERIPELDPSRPFHIPEGLRNDPNTLETVLQSYASVMSENSKALKDYIYPRFENILEERGTLHISDPIINEELADLPREWKEVIEESGGFKSFMLQSMKFAVVGETLCFFSEMLSLYNPSKVNGLDEFNHLYSCDINLVEGSDPSSHMFKIEGSMSDLNPNAAEYSPSESKSDNSTECMSSVSVSNSDVATNQCLESNIMPNFELCVNGVGSTSDIYSNSAVSSQTNLVHTCSSEQNLHKNQSKLESEQSEKSLRTLLTNLRQPLSGYSLSADICEESTCLTTGLTQSSASLSTNSENPHLGDSVSEKFFDKLLILKSHLAGDPFSCDILESIYKLCSDNSDQKIKSAVSCVQSVDKCEQAGTPEITLISEGVMKEDEELKEMTDKLNVLVIENGELSKKQAALEEQLVESLDAVSRLQNKFNVELTSLEKRIAETEALKKEEGKAMKTKISSLEKEIKQWRQKHDLVVESEKDTKKENAKLQVKVNSYISKLEEMEEMSRRCDDYEEKLANQSVIVEKCEKIVQENCLLMDKRMKECSEACERAKKSEVELLYLKKATFLEKLDAIIMSGNQKIFDLQNSITKAESTLQPYLSNSLNMFLSEIKMHAQHLVKLRLDTQKKADELVAKVQEGVPLSDLEDFNFPALPYLPNMGDLAVPQTTPMMTSQNETQQNSLSFAYPQSVPTVSQSTAGLAGQQNFLSNSQLTNSGSNYLFLPQPSLFNQVLHNTPNANTQSTRHLQELIMSQMSYQNSVVSTPHVNQISSLTSQLLNQPTNPQVVSSVSKQLSMQAPPTSLAVRPPVANSVSSTNSTSIQSSLLCNNAVPPSIPASTTVIVPSHTAVTETWHTNSSLMSLESKVLPKSASTEHESSVPTTRVLSPVPLLASSSSSSENIESTRDVDESGSVNSYHSLPSMKSSRNLPSAAVNDVRETSSQQDGSLPLSVSGASPALELGYSTGKEGEQPTPGTSFSQVPSCRPQPAPQKHYHKAEKKNNYSKILDKLRVRYSQISEAELVVFIRQYREEKTRLTGMTIDAIVKGVSELVERALKLRQTAVHVFRSKSIVNKPLVTAPPKVPAKPAPSNENPWGKSGASVKSAQSWSGGEDDDKSCAICLEDMTSFNSMKMECGHKFHRPCIKPWLDKNSNCPKCRVHLLLPEDYPALSGK